MMSTFFYFIRKSRSDSKSKWLSVRNSNTTSEALRSSLKEIQCILGAEDGRSQENISSCFCISKISGVSVNCIMTRLWQTTCTIISINYTFYKYAKVFFQKIGIITPDSYYYIYLCAVQQNSGYEVFKSPNIASVYELS